MTAASADREARLARALDELLARARAGAGADVEAAARGDAELARELRALWDLAELAELAATDPDLPAAGDAASRAQQPPSLDGFELIEELGRGGMGVVWRALQKDLGREVALKMILRGPHASPVDTARFRAEASSAARLDHEAILPVHEIGESEGQLFFTMKLVEGGTLAQRLAHGPLEAREAARILLPVARAVQHAHENGVLHRDLKPSNILLDADGRPFVADFGLARRLSPDASLTRSECLVGTPAYMAPEQAAGSRGTISAATDVHGLGAVLYHMLTGRPPFSGASALETVLAVLEQEPVPPRLLQPRVDRGLEMVALKCLQKPPELRYASAQELAGDLAAFLADEPLRARRGLFRQVLAGVFRTTHHAVVLESWGRLWMWHGAVVLGLCSLTFVLERRGVATPGPYLWLWGGGTSAWALVFWLLRRRAGPVTFVERQLAHLWGSSIVACFLLLVIEMLLGLPVLRLAPMIAVVSAGVFVGKAALLSGRFYLQAGALYLTALAMALWPRWGMLLFGVVSCLSFAIPGWQAHRSVRRRTGPSGSP